MQVWCQRLWSQLSVAGGIAAASRELHAPGPLCEPCPAQRGDKVVGGSSNFTEVVLRAVLRAAHQ